jgi:two-component system, NarL family, nitrate/nitrite response regulator NarL
MPADPDRVQFPALMIEDHELLSQALAHALRPKGVDVTAVRPTSTPQVLAAVDRHDPSIVLLDLDLGTDLAPGEALVPDLVDKGVRVLVVTGTEDLSRIGAAVDAGAEGFVHKSAGFDALLDAMQRMAEGEAPTDPSELRRLDQRIAREQAEHQRQLQVFDRLTDREQAVLARLMEGASVDEIASDNVVSVATVRSQVRGVLTKLGVNSQLAAVALAHRLGWDHPGRG